MACEHMAVTVVQGEDWDKETTKTLNSHVLNIYLYTNSEWVSASASNAEQLPTGHQ